MATVKELKNMARELGVNNHNRLRKPDLIRAIQQAEGNSPCFKRIPDCAQMDCLFRPDCLGEPGAR